MPERLEPKEILPRLSAEDALGVVNELHPGIPVRCVKRRGECQMIGLIDDETIVGTGSDWREAATDFHRVMVKRGMEIEKGMQS